MLNLPSFFIPTQGYPSHLFSNPFPIPIVDRYPQAYFAPLPAVPQLALTPFQIQQFPQTAARGPAFCS